MARTRRRNTPDSPFISGERSDQPYWYVVRDQWQKIVEVQPLEPNADLRAVLREVLQTHEERGWIVEEKSDPTYGHFFCSKGKERLFVAIQPTDPGKPLPQMYGPMPPMGRTEE